MDQTDARLLSLLQGRNEQALTELQSSCGRSAYSLAAGILHDGQDAEECVNEALLQLWNHIPPACPDSVRAYFLRTVRNLCFNRARDMAAQKRAGEVDAGVPADELAAMMPDLGEEDRRSGAAEALRAHLSDFLRSEDETDRALFMGRYWHACPVGELAAEWGMSRFAVSRRLKATRERLRAYLCERGYRYDE